MWSPSCKLNLKLVSLLLQPSVSTRIRARGLLRWSHQIGEELNSLSSSLDEELVQLIDHCLDSSNHVLQPLSTTCQLPQVGAIISFNDHRLFSGTVLQDLFSMVVIQVWLSTLLLGGVSGQWWQVRMLSVKPSSPCYFGW